MPQRRLPQSNVSRYQAVDKAKQMKDTLPPPVVIPFTAATIARIDALHPLYKVKMDAVDAALQAQLDEGAQSTTTRTQAEYFITDFYSALQRAIRRGTFDASVRPLYGLNGNDATLPNLKTEADITHWGQQADTGEAARILAGGAAISFPSMAEVNMVLVNFNTINMKQANAKLAYDAAQEDLAAQNAEADLLVLKMWNETETAFDEGDKPSMRRKAREWGVTYVPTAGETPTPEEFSVEGAVGLQTSPGEYQPLTDVEVTVLETNDTTFTDAEGNYFIPLLPDGNYNLRFKKLDYIEQTLPVTLAAGSILNLNVEMKKDVPEPPVA
jgi:hypothetical protein